MVEESVPLFATHRAVAGPWLRPQALTSSGSVTGATPGWSDTWLVMLNRIPAGTAPSWASLSGMGAASAAGAIRPAATAMAVALLDRRDMGDSPVQGRADTPSLRGELPGGAIGFKLERDCLQKSGRVFAAGRRDAGQGYSQGEIFIPARSGK